MCSELLLIRKERDAHAISMCPFFRRAICGAVSFRLHPADPHPDPSTSRSITPEPQQPADDGGDDGGQLPPGGSSSPPQAPGNLAIQKRVCASQEYSMTLAWFDAADNEDGYRIYRNGQLIASVEEAGCII